MKSATRARSIVKVVNLCLVICLCNQLMAKIPEFVIWACINIGEFFLLVPMLLTNYRTFKFNRLKQEEEQRQGVEELVALIKHNIINEKKRNIPWLLFPADGPPCLLNLYEEGGRLYNLNMPKQIEGRCRGYICGSSNGWMAVITTLMTDF